MMTERSTQKRGGILASYARPASGFRVSTGTASGPASLTLAGILAILARTPTTGETTTENGRWIVAKLYIIAAKVNGNWGAPDYVRWDLRTLRKAYENCETDNGPDTFRAFDVVNNRGVRF